MREIKFRMWSKNYEQMFDNDALVLMYTAMAKTTKKNVPAVNESEIELPDEGIALPFQDDAVLMQYTGLKDKTGKEVYEGDIIVCGHDTGKSYNRYVIEFSDSAHAYLAKQVGCTSHIGSGYWGNTMLVIGNIHENPELLEEE